MKLQKARVQQYRSIRDSGWFDVEAIKTILVGPNEAGKTVLLKAIEQINPPADVPKFDPLSPNPPKDTDGRREESGRGMRELQGK